MPEAPLSKLLGLNVTQTATEIVIKKADLAMTAAAVNGSEQIAVAILKRLAEGLPKSTWDDTREVDLYAETGIVTPAFRTIGDASETRDDIPLTFHLTRPTTAPQITPDNY
jgi:hypothetical protein